MSLHSPLTCMASDEHSNVIINSCFFIDKVLFSSYCFQYLLFVFGFPQFEYDIPRCNLFYWHAFFLLFFQLPGYVVLFMSLILEFSNNTTSNISLLLFSLLCVVYYLCIYYTFLKISKFYHVCSIFFFHWFFYLHFSLVSSLKPIIRLTDSFLLRCNKVF